ncbi:MAG: M1 family metallopeptidase, partial [Fuerstiella sp.]|nr:M1 family metallopeptidase [Fuerstiella sp.]
MAMSFWPKEGQPLWGQYSTAAVIHTIRTYSKFTFDYSYPVINSVNGAIPGMDYPMMTFQSRRPEEDGTYSESTRNSLISVIIHEVDHSWFPMIVNSDERQWRWMDEGMNSFIQFLTEQEWEDAYPSRILRPDRRKKMRAYLLRGDVRP